MRHQCGNKKLGKPTDQRIALLRSLSRALILHGKIQTTDVRAKALRGFVENLITLGKEGSVHSVRRALAILPDKDAISIVFKNLAPRYEKRPGGYTRVIRAGFRRGDASPVSVIELVD